MSAALAPEVAAFLEKIPFARHLGIRIEALAKGLAQLAFDIRPEYTTSWGTVHGGAVLALLDVTLSMAARTLYDPPRSMMTIELSTHFLGTATGVLRAEGRVLRAGRTTIFCEGEARSEKAELVAKAVGTFRARSAQ
jgi:uncharacterized protein (TIGR00369 family)